MTTSSEIKGIQKLLPRIEKALSKVVDNFDEDFLLTTIPVSDKDIEYKLKGVDDVLMVSYPSWIKF